MKINVNKNAYGESQASLDYWKNHRKSLNDLYPSERHFLEPALRISNSTFTKLQF